MPEKAAGTKRKIEKGRTEFRSLIAVNPNYFGNLIESPFEPVEKIVSNTDYEQLTTLGYNPTSKTLFATFDIRRDFGYGGDLCADGSTEFVRFYVDFGSGWKDAGLAASEVHDIPEGRDCDNDDTHPLSYSLELDYSPPRNWCTDPQLPRVRAILSWDVEPPAGDPDWLPVWGNVLECHIQIDKSWWFGDLFEVMKTALEIPPDLLESIEAIQPAPEPLSPIPGPEPVPPFTPIDLKLDDLAKRYVTDDKEFSVEPTRFAFSEYQTIKKSTTPKTSSSVDTWYGSMLGIGPSSTAPTTDTTDLTMSGSVYSRRVSRPNSQGVMR